MSNINSVKIELIPILVTLLETLSVTECAKKLGVTQSAVSHSLKKLRDQFGDEIVIRDGNKLSPTAKAERIYPSLKRWLGDLENIVQATDFDPKNSERVFYIGATDIVEQMFLPRIMEILKKEGPYINIRFVRWNADRVYSQLMNGELDMAIGVRNFNYPNLMQKTLYKETFASAVRKKHPYLKSNNGLEDFLSYPHTMTSSGDREKGVVDKSLEKINRKRRLTHTVTNFSSAPFLLENSDCILTAPKNFLEFCSEFHQISVFDPPLKLPTFEVRLFWSKKSHQDQANIWLREILYRVFSVRARSIKDIS